MLMKDFFIDEYQIYLARHHGADAILLIAALLTEAQINSFTEMAHSLGMDVLLEVHDQAELEMALNTRANIIGVNNRDLHTFEVNTKTFIHLLKQIPPGKITVAESGYSPDSANQVQDFANAVLIGSSIMRSSDMAAAVQKIKTPRKKFKACGIRTLEAATHCDEGGIAFIGLNFVVESKRRIDPEIARNICQSLRNSYSVGIFQNQSIEEVNQIARDVGLDFVQLSGSEDLEYIKQIQFPIIKTLKFSELKNSKQYDDEVAMYIVDGANPGSGEGYDYSGLKGFKPSKPFLIAGGVNSENAGEIMTLLPASAGLDAASGIETEGAVDVRKIDNIAKAIGGS